MKVVDGFFLKAIALITMTIDHIGAVLFPQYIVLRYIGRLAFPIFCFLIVEGFNHTRNVKKYIARLFIFALLSEAAFDFAFFDTFFYPAHQNIFFELTLGVITLYLFEKYEESFFAFLIPPAFMCISMVLTVDYSWKGILMIFSIYYFKKNQTLIVRFIMVALFIYANLSTVQIYALLALIPIYFYNGKRGVNIKYLFYIYYPLHLTILGLLGYDKII